MPTKVSMPQFGESVEEGTITKWLKGEGDAVEEYEPLVEVNTDKVDTEVPSPVSGILLKIMVPEGTVTQAGTVLAWVGKPGESIPDAEGGPSFETAPEHTVERAAAIQTAASGPPRLPGRDHDLGFISPVVARIAEQHQVDLTQVQGTGREGRITKKDILAYINLRGALPEAVEGAPEVAVPAPEFLPPAQAREGEPARGELIPLTPVRRSIAEHMVRSKHTSPHVTTVMEADLSRVVNHRTANKETFARAGANLTFTAYFAAAAVASLKAFPIVNASWTDNGIQLHREINIGIATSLESEGLIVPVVKGADGLSLLGIARAVNDLAGRARTKALVTDEVQQHAAGGVQSSPVA